MKLVLIIDIIMASMWFTTNRFNVKKSLHF